MKIPITEFQLPSVLLSTGNGLVGYNYILKKEQQKKPRLITASGLKYGHQRLSVSSSEQIKGSQNLFQNPNQILS